MSQKLCARYLYFKRNVEKFGVRVIGQKIRYINYITVELHVSAYIEAIFRFSMQAKRYGGGGPDAEIS